MVIKGNLEIRTGGVKKKRERTIQNNEMRFNNKNNKKKNTYSKSGLNKKALEGKRWDSDVMINARVIKTARRGGSLRRLLVNVFNEIFMNCIDRDEP